MSEPGSCEGPGGEGPGRATPFLDGSTGKLPVGTAGKPVSCTMHNSLHCAPQVELLSWRLPLSETSNVQGLTAEVAAAR